MVTSAAVSHTSRGARRLHDREPIKAKTLMLHYLIRRVLLGVLTLLLITFLIFGLIRNMPGSPLTVNMAEIDPSRQISQEQVERLKKIYGLDKHWTVAYLAWLKNLARL